MSYVEYNGKQGWIYSAESEAVFVEGTERYLDAPFGAQKIERDDISSAPEFETQPSTKPADTESNGSSKTYIIIGVCAAAAIIGVVALIVTKKRKSK